MEKNVGSVEDEVQFLEDHLNWLNKLSQKLENVSDLYFLDPRESKGLSKNEARCARIAARLGFDVSIFRPPPGGHAVSDLLGECQKQIKTIPQMIDKLGHEAERVIKVPLTGNEIRILRVLAKSQAALLQVEIQAEVDLSRRTVWNALKRLRELGYVRRPFPRKHGEIITSQGLARLEFG